MRDQALNERDYGDLVGMNKDDARKKWGEEQVLIWRRSYDVPPPGGESLKDTVARALPYFVQEILPRVLRGERTLISAHGNSLRALIMVLERLTPEKHPEARARHRRADHLSPQCGLDRRLAARSGGVSGQAEILVLDAAAAKAALGELADVLADCVEGGASVSFMLPFGRDDAAKFFEKVIASVARGRDRAGRGEARRPHRRHRAARHRHAAEPAARGDIKKLLVHRSARNLGLGAKLMARAEQEAKARGRTLLVLDTAGTRSRTALRAHRLAARRRRAGLRDVAGRRLLRHDVFLEASC